MSRHCPSCGSEVEVQPKTVEVQGGTCPDCSHTFVVLPPMEGLTTAHVVAPTAPGAEGAAAEESDEDEEELAAVCAECGGALVLAVNDENALSATCDDCDTEFRLVRADAPAPAASPAPSRGFSDDRRGPRSGPGGPSRDWQRPAGPSRARPCRKCGGPIVFSEGSDGGMTGTCQSCGNEFKLRPREDGDRGGYGGRGGGGDRPPWNRNRGPPRFDSRRGGGGGGGGYRRRERSDSDDDRPYRRRRRDD